MAVEIQILSGARQGERIELDQGEFRIGDGAYCEVVFNPNHDDAVRGRVAAIQCDDDGWSIRNVGRGDLLVNQDLVVGRARLRSGDVVRMSDRGPDFAFTIDPIAPAAELTAATVPAAPSSQAPAIGQASDPLKTKSDESAEIDLLLDEATLTTGPTLAKPPRLRRRFPPAVGPIAAGAVIVALVFWGLSHRESSAPDVPPPQGAATVEVAPSSPPAEQPRADHMAAAPVAEKPETDATAAPAAPVAEPEAAAPPLDPSKAEWDAVEQQLQPAVYLLMVEQPDGGFSYPFATATAVGPHVLLSSASVVAHLENDFQAKGFTVWAKNATLDVKYRVVQFAVHKGWALTPQPEKRIYFDLGVLRVDEELPQRAELATNDQRSAAGTALEVACIGVAHQGDAIRADDAVGLRELTPRSTRGKILITTRLDPDPNSPRLLHVKGTIPPNVYGSPIVNRQGRILAVYAEAALVDASQPMPLHYAAVVEPELLAIAFGPDAAKVWQSPLPPAPPEPGNKKE